MNTRMVIISTALSLLPGVVLLPTSGPEQEAMPFEPAADLNASVVLESISEEGSRLTGKVRVSLMSISSDMTVTLRDLEGAPLDQVALGHGERRVVRSSVSLRPGEDNDIGYWVEARRADGSVERQRLHLAVPLDPEMVPEEVADGLQYQGSVIQEGGR